MRQVQLGLSSLPERSRERGVGLNALLFDAYNNEAVFPDRDGIECPDIDCVKHEAARGLADFAAEVLPEGECRKLSIDVRDETGRHVLTTSLAFEMQLLAKR